MYRKLFQSLSFPYHSHSAVSFSAIIFVGFMRTRTAPSGTISFAICFCIILSHIPLCYFGRPLEKFILFNMIYFCPIKNSYKGATTVKAPAIKASGIDSNNK